MSAARGIFSQLLSEFGSHGMTNPIQVAENVAFLLLTKPWWAEIRDRSGVNITNVLEDWDRHLQGTYPGLRIPQPPPAIQWGLNSFQRVLDILEVAWEASPHHSSAGNFFQREIRVELLKTASGAQYPTPYHIADLMAQMVLRTNRIVWEVFDPAAGSAGLLTAIYKNRPRPDENVLPMTGCDFDPVWAGLGAANLLLHGAENATLHVGSALSFYQTYGAHFDGVVMNPPFGGTRDTYEVGSSVGPQFGRSNATVLAALALHTLRDNGIAAFLAPSGLLFGRGGEAVLRQQLYNNNLEGVITFSKSAFYPHSNVEAHLVVVQKLPENAERPTHPVWFCQLAKDGYRDGADRDLTLEPTIEINEIPRVRDLILNTRQNQWESLLTFNEWGNLQQSLFRPEDGLNGIGVRFTGNESEIQWEATHLDSGVLIKVRDAQKHLRGWSVIPYEGDNRTAIPATQQAEFVWTTLLPGENWDENVVGEWSAEQEDVTATITLGEAPGLTLKQRQTRYTFQPDGDQAVKGCLLDVSGLPLTPWLSLQGDLGKIQDVEFASKFSAKAIFDGDESRIGWIILLTKEQEANQDAQLVSSAILLIVYQELVQLFSNPEIEGEGFALLENGWMRFSPGAPGFIETGSKVHLRENLPLQGLAIGPASWEPAGYRVFGALVARSVFDPHQDGKGDYRPSIFLPEPEAPPIGHPSDVLASIRKNQNNLSIKLDSLLTMLGGDPRYDETANQAVDPLPGLTALLNSQQQQFWELLGGKRVDNQPAHFNTADVVGWCQETEVLKELTTSDISQQLNLFSRMGLVLPVNSNGQNLYRCLTQGDITEPRGEES